jgi:uncharacterized protein YidB (DUF937 family)
LFGLSRGGRFSALFERDSKGASRGRPVAATALGGIERLVGALQQLGGIDHLLGRLRGAGAHARRPVGNVFIEPILRDRIGLGIARVIEQA